MSPESTFGLSDTTLWGAMSLFSHVTWEPFLTVSVFGWKANCAITTVLVLAGAEVPRVWRYMTVITAAIASPANRRTASDPPSRGLVSASEWPPACATRQTVAPVSRDRSGGARGSVRGGQQPHALLTDGVPVPPRGRAALRLTGRAESGDVADQLSAVKGARPGSPLAPSGP